MQSINAAGLADEYIKLMIANVPNMFGTSPAFDQSSAKQAAQSLAALRAELIVLLTPQQ